MWSCIQPVYSDKRSAGRVCICGRTRCTILFLFLRNSSRAKPDAPVKESPHDHTRSYYHSHHVVCQPIGGPGWGFLCVSMTAAGVQSYWNPVRLWQLGARPTCETEINCRHFLTRKTAMNPSPSQNKQLSMQIKSIFWIILCIYYMYTALFTSMGHL